MPTQEDHGFKYIMVYQNHLIKFVLLHALQSKTAEEVAHHLADIFLTFGAPCILHSDHGRVCQTSWLYFGLSVNWFTKTEFMKNWAYHSGIKQTPYKAMFGTELRLELITSSLPLDVIKEIEDEDDVKEALNKINVVEAVNETFNELELSHNPEEIAVMASSNGQITAAARQEDAEALPSTSIQSPTTAAANQKDPEAIASRSSEPQITPACHEDPEAEAIMK
ncbi:KRAB-A domain-containing protein 2-like [Schistocerca americana]|uniref:KRAB-A domain-containing protein 2-like n=1 Tax=Schistocerca americana TaxID=7009 RepID=UPI001F50285A|nr:KRAB-A domain-containing protein 2-like [Schistocerca americana]